MRLEGWKEISSYLGIKEKQAQRWEQQSSLPVHREARNKRAIVFAWTEELDQWRRTRTVPPSPSKDSIWPPRRRVVYAAVVTLCLLGLLFPFGIRLRKRPIAERKYGRVLVRGTSEGHNLTRISLPSSPYFLAASSDGKKLFGSGPSNRFLTVTDAETLKSHRIPLPFEAGAMTVSPKGMIYIGSLIEGIVKIDVLSEKILGTIYTGGPVRDIAVTSDGAKVFVAAEHAGLRRFYAESDVIEQISDRICPEHLAMDQQQERLYVSYQCGGPGGRAGHDIVEVFDVNAESSLGTLTGLPMVGSVLVTSPNGKLLLVDGRDACSNPAYDHEGCPTVPGTVAHLFRAFDLTQLHSFGFFRQVPVAFLDNIRFVMKGPFLMVVDSSRFKVLEKVRLGDSIIDASFLDLARNRLYAGSGSDKSLGVFDLEPAECAQNPKSLSVQYRGDGTPEDAIALTALDEHGGVRYAPGRVGQAFVLDGKSFLSTNWMGSYRFMRQDASVVFYVKFGSDDGVQTILRWTTRDPAMNISISKLADGQIVFDASPPGLRLTSKTKAEKGNWYHVAVTKSDKETGLFINGKKEATAAGVLGNEVGDGTLYLGATDSTHAIMRGLLDEVSFYGRALTAQEIKAEFELRESGTCKI